MAIAFSGTFQKSKIQVSYWGYVLCSNFASFYATIEFLSVLESLLICALIYEIFFEENLRKYSGKVEEREEVAQKHAIFSKIFPKIDPKIQKIIFWEIPL